MDEEPRPLAFASERLGFFVRAPAFTPADPNPRGPFATKLSGKEENVRERFLFP
jgi:hypothetical protein